MTRTLSPIAFACSIAVLVVVGGIGAPAHAQTLEWYAAGAKEKGETVVELRSGFGHNEVPVLFETWLTRSSVLLVEPVEMPRPVQTVTSSEILTWRVFKVRRTLSTQDPSFQSTECTRRPMPEDLRLGQDEVALPVRQGEAVINGVTVRIKRGDEHPPFRPGESYVLVAYMCSNRSIALLDDVGDVFRLDASGKLTNSWTDSSNVELVRSRFNTLQLFEDRLKQGWIPPSIR